MPFVRLVTIWGHSKPADMKSRGETMMKCRERMRGEEANTFDLQNPICKRVSTIWMFQG